MKNVLGLALAVPKKDGDEHGNAPPESMMRGGSKVDPHLSKVWTSK